MSNNTEEGIASIVWLAVFGTLLITVAIFALIALPFVLVGGAIAFAILSYYKSDAYKEKKARAYTHQLYEEAKAHFGDAVDSDAFIAAVARRLPDHLSPEVTGELLDLALLLYEVEEFGQLRPPPQICNSIEGARYRDYLSAQTAKDGKFAADIATNVVASALSFFAQKIPGIEGSGFTVTLSDLIDFDAGDLERFLNYFYAEDVLQVGLFKQLRGIIDSNLAEVEVLPTKYKGTDLLKTYLDRTPFLGLFDLQVPFGLPERSRYEHHWILAGTGHGKTQTLQHMLVQDFEKVADGEASVVVIDSQNQLLQTISKLDLFGPGQPLDGKLVWIDPGDVEFPLALNLFDAKIDRINSYSMRDRERLLNNLTELYEFVFRSLLSSPMTDRQSTLFQFITRLMLQIPNASIQTLVAFLGQNDLKGYEQHIARLDATARNFFETDYRKGAYKDTQQQVRNRLYSILRSATFDRMFSASENRIDLFTELATAKVVLINTDKDLLKEDGSSFFGRFFIALLVQAIEERSQHADPLPTFLYFDEAEDYFDEQFPRMLATVRKHNIGMIIAHQFLAQTQSSQLSASLMSNTSIKFVGGVSPQDANALAPSMETKPEFIRSQPKGSFAAYVKGTTPSAVSLRIPFFTMENMPKLSDAEREQIRDDMRRRYAIPFTEPVQGDNFEMTEPDVPTEPEAGDDIAPSKEL